MLKISYIVSTLRKCGPTNQLYNIISNICTKNIVNIITLSSESSDSRIDDFKKLGIEIYQIKKGRFCSYAKIANEINKIYDINKPDIIHTSGIRSDIINANFLSKNYTTLSTIRNYPFDDYIMKFGLLQGSLMSISHINAFKKIKNLISCSTSIQTTLEKKHNIKSNVISNATNTSLFGLSNEMQKNQLRIKLNIPKDKFVFISTGSLIKRKNLFFMINSFLESQTSQKSVLIIAGDGPLLNKLKKMYQDKKNIILTGFINNVKEYLQASDFFVSTSLSEGLPNSVIEALSCGLPAMLSNIDAHKEFVREKVKSAFLFNIKNSSELINLYEKIITYDYAAMQSDALQLSLDYDIKVMNANYENYYKNLMENKN